METKKPQDIRFLEILQQGYQQNYSNIPDSHYKQIETYIQNFCQKLLLSVKQELEKGKVNFDDIQMSNIQDINNFYKEMQINNEEYKVEFIHEIQKFLKNFNEIYVILIKFIMGEQFFNLLDEIEILHNEINIFQLQKDLLNHILYEKFGFLKQSSIKNQSFYPLESFNQYISLFFNTHEFREVFHLIITNFVNNYQTNRRIVIEEVYNFKKNTGKTQINNKYIIIGYLKELSEKLYTKVEQNLMQTQIIFNDQKMIHQYSKFIIEQHELYDLINKQLHPISEFSDDSDDNDTNQTDDQVKQNFKEQKIQEQNNHIALLDLKKIDKKLQQITDNTQNTYMQSIVREDGIKGLLVTVTTQQHIENEEQKKEEEPLIQEKIYLLRMNNKQKFILINGQYISTKWMILDESQNDIKKSLLWDFKKFNQKQEIISEDFLIQDILKPQKPSPDFMANQQNIGGFSKYSMGAASNVGLSLGYCLANINNYPNTQEFLKDFGQTAALNGSITYMMVSIPILGPLLVLGGLGYMSLQLYQNDTASKRSKLKQSGKIALQTGTGIGGTLGGAVLGQALIPIPVLGALVGGILGGFLSATASQQIIKLIDKDKVKKVVIKLEKEQVIDNNQGYWVYSQEILDIYGIKSKFFYKSMPEVFWPTPDVWLTIVTYSFISFFYGQQEQKQHQENMKQWEKTKKKKLKEFKKNNENQQDLIDQYTQDLLKEEKQILQQEDANVWPPTIQFSQNYIVKKNIETLQFYQQIEEFVIKVLKEV